MAAVSLFWDTNMAAMTSCENVLSDYVGFPSLAYTITIINYKGKPMQTADSADIGKINCIKSIKISAVHLPHNKH